MTKKRAKEAETAPFRITNPFSGELPTHFSVLVYGHTGVGKTGLGATAPKPIILDGEVDSAEVTVRAVGNPDARVVSITDMETLREVYNWLAHEDHGFETVVVDTLWEVQRMMMEEGRSRYPQKRAFDRVMTQQDWGLISEDFRIFLNRLRALPMHKVFTAHAQGISHETDVVKPLIQGKQMLSYAQRYMDLVGYMYLDEDEDGTSSRYLMTKGTHSVAAKNRGERLPPVIRSPNLTKIFRRMAAIPGRSDATAEDDD